MDCPTVDYSLNAIWIGVVSGVITALLIQLGIIVFKEIFVPWFETVTYKGLDINGQWIEKSINSSGAGQEMVFNIQQKGHKVNGILNITTTFSNGKKVIKTFIINGQFFDRFLLLTGKNASKGMIGCLSLLLEVISNGKIMKGKRVWYHLQDCEIQSVDATLTKEE